MKGKVVDIGIKKKPYTMEIQDKPLQQKHLFNACKIGDTALACDKCFGMGFGVKVENMVLPPHIEHTLVCLTCGGEQPLLGSKEKLRFSS